MRKQKINTRPMLPSIWFTNESGEKKYVNGRDNVSMILQALNSGESRIENDDVIIDIIGAIKTDEVWEVEVSISREEVSK